MCNELQLIHLFLAATNPKREITVRASRCLSLRHLYNNTINVAEPGI